MMHSRSNPQHRWSWFALLLAEYGVSNLGHFAVLAILSLYLLQTLKLPAEQAAALMLLASLSFRLTRIFFAPLVDRFSPRTAILLALSFACVGYLGLAFSTSMVAVIFFLLVIGAGYGTNILAVKTVTAHSETANDSPLLRYASLNTSFNLAAAAGPMVGSALFLSWQPRSVFLFAAACYVAAVALAFKLPHVESRTSQQPNWKAGLRKCIRVPMLRQSLIFTVIGFFLYSQLYATLPLFVDSVIGQPTLLGTFFALNAALVVIAQVPVSHLMIRWQLSASQLAQLAYLIFAGGFALLWLWPFWQVTYGAVVLWTLAEILLMPTLDTLIAEGTSPEHRVVAFALSGVAMAVGEGLGNFTGVGVAGWLLQAGKMHNLFGFFMVAALAAAVVAVFVRRRQVEELVQQYPQT